MKLKQEVNKIKLPKNLHYKSQAGVLKAKSEMGKPKRRWTLIAIPTIVAAFALLLLLFSNLTGMLQNGDIAEKEIGSSIAILRIDNTDYVLDSNLNSSDYTIGDKIGEVKTKLTGNALPEDNLSSNYLEVGTSIYFSAENKDIILAKGKDKNEYEVFTKSSEGNFNDN
ncbi:hypothetical protein [Heyndrickxia acidiproducens]|uniref:hypothetical protein n=1 Tax=Heyndrickxia acidiproducens TaxID=1121084 RepID=UPI00037AB501|nr:hypothetical protein [Heyndrickxia acidiproducens]